MPNRMNRFLKHGFVYLLAIAMLSACTSKQAEKQIAGTPPPQQPNMTYDAANNMRVEPQYREQQGESNTEDYKKIDENEFLAVTQNPLSTFSIDVDTASYSNIRRFIND